MMLFWVGWIAIWTGTIAVMMTRREPDAITDAWRDPTE